MEREQTANPTNSANLFRGCGKRKQKPRKTPKFTKFKELKLRKVKRLPLLETSSFRAFSCLSWFSFRNEESRNFRKANHRILFLKFLPS